MLFFSVTVGDFIAPPTWNPCKGLWSEETIGLDYETYSPTGKWEGIEHYNGCLRLIMVYLPSKKVTVVVDWENMSADDKEFVEALKGALAKGIETIAHSATFEYKWTKQHLGVKIKRLRCTLIANQMLDAGLHFRLTGAYGAKPNSLKNVVKRRLGFDVDKTEQNSFWGTPTLSPEQLRYAALDPYLAYSCWVAMLPKLQKLGISFKAEMLAVAAFGELEFNGMPADKTYLEEYAGNYKAVADRLYDELVMVFREEIKKHPELVKVFPKKDQQALQSTKTKEDLIRGIASCPPPLEFDYTSKRNQKKLQAAIGLTYTPEIDSELYETALRCALRCPDKRQVLLTKKAQANYDKWLSCQQWVKENPEKDSSIVTIDIKIRSPQQVKPFLEHLLGVTLESTESEDLFPYIAHPFVLKLIEYRSIFRLQGYLEGYLRAYREGAVFGRYSQLAVSGIGRSDSSEPNLQNVPKMSPTCKKYKLPPVREVFRLEAHLKDSVVFGLLDAAGSHLQIARDLSKDANLLKALREAIKVHYITCQAILKIQGREETLEDIKKACSKGATGELADLLSKIYPQSKTLIYAFLNLAGPKTLSETFVGYGDTVDLNTCKEFLDACKLGYQGLWAFIQKVLKDAKANTGVLYDTPRVYNPVVCEMLACGFEVASCVNHSHWLGEFTTMVTVDGRVLNLEKASRKTPLGVERYLDGARIVSSNWLAMEATAMKLTLGLLALWSQENPAYNFQLRGFAHDEIIFSCDPEYKQVCGDKVYNTMRDSFRRVCPNFAPEDPAFDGWVTSWHDK